MKKSKLSPKVLFILAILPIIAFLIELINKKFNLYFLLYGISILLIAIEVNRN